MTEKIQMNLLPKKSKDVCPTCGSNMGGGAFERDRELDDQMMEKTDTYAKRGEHRGAEAGFSKDKESFTSSIAKRKSARGSVVRK